jgi:F-type H+-transporting ATPase subunit a
LLIIALPIRAILKNRTSPLRYIVISFIRSFANLVESSLGYFSFNHFVFVTSLFVFIFMCNVISIIPWVEEPTKDINTTLACALISFIYIQYFAIATHGLKEYLKEFASPFFAMIPLHLIGKLATIVSLSFRLFGNIFGGAAISHIFSNVTRGVIISELLAIPINIIIVLFFILFEGFLQAFVFTMLTVTYLGLAVQPSHEEHT